MKKLSLIAILVSFLVLLSFWPLQKTKSATTKIYFVLISIDACRADYLDKVDMPNLKILANQGVQYSNAWVGQLRNDTPPGHTTLATGSFPKNDGILGFGWKDPKTGKAVNVTSWEAVTSGLMTKTIKDSGCTSVGTLVKKAYPDAKVVALSSDKYYAATGLGAESADYILFSKNDKSTDPKTKGTKVFSPTGVKGHLAPAEIMNDPDLKRIKKDNLTGDTWAIDLAIKMVEKINPQVMLINLPQTDESGHATGGITNMKAMGEVLTNVDTQIGKLMDAYKKAGIYEQTIFVVTSDHGMTPKLKNIETAEITNILKNQVAAPGGRADYYLLNPDNAWFIAELIAGSKIEGIDAVYYKAKDEKGNFTYYPSFTTEEKIPKNLDSCYRYLTATYTSGKSPDLVIITRENWKFAGSKMPGDHGQATWLNQHIPLIIAGPGVKVGAILDSPARLVDIGPTIIALMQVKLGKMDGAVLADALVSPTAEQTKKLESLNKWLTPLMEAFKQKSIQDTK